MPLTGLVLTKIDGDARGGAALSISAVTGLPVKFLGTGEKTDALEPFHPDRLAGRILGMGDVLTLVERAQEAFDQKQAEKARRRSSSPASFTLEDMLEQLQQVKKMGPLGQVIGDDPRAGRDGQAGPGVDRPGRPEADRGDHPLDDAGRSGATPTSSTPAGGGGSRPARGPPSSRSTAS